ncbi:hypothetical protein E2C01_048651 [Portunus trituberculatus]|uniref:Uncharacterized protein n=1 Tax=Portunus trituberculatus TaxID=210409 RepID=A0A5B7GB41_PORTR|nr:hypothetical protein [Portunus trituberculatus]
MENITTKNFNHRYEAVKGWRRGRKSPESSKVELLATSAIETDEMAVVPSVRNKGGKDEEIKLLEMFLAKCQKSRGELEFQSF